MLIESWPVKYRPVKFEEVIGQDVVVDILKAVVEDQKVPAVLLCGRSGVGKTTILRIYAHNLLYPGKEFSSLENDPDFLELDASTSGGVGALRELAETIEHKPMAGRYRFVLFDEVHAVTKDGYNVLLKMIEEPHPHVRFGFATTNPEKVPGTILGRSMVFSLRPVSRDVLAGRVRSVAVSERLRVDDAVVDEIVRLADGQVRDALKLLQQISSVENPTAGMIRELEGLSSAVTEVDFLRALLRKEVEPITEYCNVINDSSVDVDRFVTGLVRFLDNVVRQRFVDGLIDTQTHAIYTLMCDLIELLRNVKLTPRVGAAMFRAWCAKYLGLIQART